MSANNSRQYAYNQAAGKALAESIHVGALVKVLKFDKKSMSVDLKPIAQRLTDGEYVAPSQTMRVPISGVRFGGFIFRPWYREGDIGSAGYLDHDMDLPLQTGNECKPNTERCHSDNDMVFQGGVVAGGWECPDIPDGFALATEDGSIYLVITQDNIRIQGNVLMEGNLTVNGNIAVIGGDVVADGISLKSHTHSDVTSGGESTGKPH